MVIGKIILNKFGNDFYKRRVNKFFFLLLSLAPAAESMAQFHLGIQGGGNLSTMDFTNNQDYKFTEVNYTQGIVTGVVFQFLGEKHAGVQAEFNYSQKGWSENDTIGDNNLKYKTRVNYAELAILTHVNIGGGKFRGIINLGPYMGYALSGKESIEDLNNGSESSSSYEFDDETDNRLDFGLLAGGGVEYRMAFGKLAVEARYSLGLGDLNKIKVRESEVSQFRVIGVIARLTMPLGKKPQD